MAALSLLGPSFLQSFLSFWDAINNVIYDIIYRIPIVVFVYHFVDFVIGHSLDLSSSFSFSCFLLSLEAKGMR